MMLVSTHGENERVGEDKFWKIGVERIAFKCLETVYNHYQHRDDMDSHNSRRQTPIAMEEIGSTKRWGGCFFAFLLALLEVNANLGGHLSGGMKAVRPILEFRRLISRKMIDNPYLRQGDITPEGRK